MKNVKDLRLTKTCENGFNKAMICVPIKQKSCLKAVKVMVEAQKTADLSEIWFDEISNFSEKNMDKILKSKKNGIIYKWQNNTKNLQIVLKKNIEYIDIDIKTTLKTIKEIRNLSPKTQIIMSFHDFKKTPNDKDLRKIISKMKVKKIDIFKIATFAKDFSDNFRILKLLSEIISQGQKAIFICMGEKGKFSRIAGHLLGNYLMYAPLNKNEKTAHGQLTVKELKKCLLK